MRLIDADELKKLFPDEGEGSWTYNITAKSYIDNAPTVELRMGRMINGTIVPIERPTGEWIPVKYRPLTTEERIEFAEYYGIEYSDTVDEKAFDCPMPDDGQEILISTRWGVSTDVADNDIIDGGYSAYGLEGNGDWEGIDAWMPLPEPYKEEKNGG